MSQKSQFWKYRDKKCTKLSEDKFQSKHHQNAKLQLLLSQPFLRKT